MIVKCSECGKEISDKAKFCVNCGCPLNLMEDKNKQAEENSSEQSDKPEVTALKTVATIILVCGIILAIILFIVGVLETNFWGVWTGLNTVLIAAGVLLISIVLWAVLRTSGNVSSDVRRISDRFKDE
jgi:hypothetical protein